MARKKSLGLAYEAVMTSYDQVVDRMNALNAQMDQWLVVSFTFLPLVPLTVLASDRPLVSPEFLLAMGLGVAVVVGAYACGRLPGRVIPLSPAILQENEWLDMSADEFRSRMIHWRGQHFDTLAGSVHKKRNATYVMFVGLGVELAALSLWAYQQVT